ncbi:27468_t:CDS:1, partial [Gigaspora margarita]
KCLRNSYLKPVYERHIVAIKLEFGNKPVSFIVDKTTNDCAKSVVNILFSYQNITKLVFVDFLNDINNIIVGQLILQTLFEWFIPFNTTRLFVSDSASYIKKWFNNILKPVMPQITHITCIAIS